MKSDPKTIKHFLCKMLSCSNCNFRPVCENKERPSYNFILKNAEQMLEAMDVNMITRAIIITARQNVPWELFSVEVE